MTRKEKIRILKAMRSQILIETRPYWASFCIAYCVVIGIDPTEPKSKPIYDKGVAQLGLRKPRTTFDRFYWYPNGDEGKPIRVKKINAAIKKLQAK